MFIKGAYLWEISILLRFNKIVLCVPYLCCHGGISDFIYYCLHCSI